MLGGKVSARPSIRDAAWCRSGDIMAGALAQGPGRSYRVLPLIDKGPRMALLEPRRICSRGNPNAYFVGGAMGHVRGRALYGRDSVSTCAPR